MQKAIKAFEKLAGDINSLYDTHYQLGRLYERVGKYEKALEHYERYSATHPEDLHPEDKTPAERLRSRLEGGRTEKLGPGANCRQTTVMRTGPRVC
jgi:tetratricopeptide (TPR) repeat protein